MKICVIGLGYVGYPLFEAFSEKYETYGIDLPEKVSELKNPKIVSDYSIIEQCDIIFVCVPTPVTIDKTPDYTILNSVTNSISPYVKKNHIFVYESTVGPNDIRDLVCFYLNKNNPNTLKVNEDFFVVFSPERVSPGVSGMDLKNLTKLVSCPVEEIRERICELYSSIGIKPYPCNDYLIAEMSKLLENIQRNVNIALMNEFAMLCSEFKDLSFMDVWKAACTKKDFIPYTTGMVGGHCIPVDPYFLIAECTKGCDLIKSALCENERIIPFITNDILKKFRNVKHICILGASYKENVGDLRESGSLKLYKELLSNLPEDCYVSIHDFFVERYNHLPKDADVYILAVPHNQYSESMDFFYTKRIYDIKGSWHSMKDKFLEYYSFGEGENYKKDK